MFEIFNLYQDINLYIVDGPEGWSVPSGMNKRHCKFWKEIHPYFGKKYVIALS